MIILLINTFFLTVDQHYYHRLLINSVGVSVDQRIVFERRNTCEDGTLSVLFITKNNSILGSLDNAENAKRHFFGHLI